jgi:hypothetical protein
MGRPLNKKYMGNRNIGSTSTTADDNIGGEGLGSVSNAVVGSININDTYKTFPLLTVAAPTIPGGVTALTAVTWEIESITIGGTNTGYTNSQTGAAATLTGLTGYIGAPTFTINTNGTGNVSAISITSRGSWTSIDGTGITTGYSINGAGGTNAMATVKFRIKSIAVTEKGSGYVALPQLSWSQTNGGTMPSGQTPALTTDSGGYSTGGGDSNVSTNQENAILAYAYIGSSLVLVDLVKQISTKRYKVRYGGTNYTARIRYDAIADGAKGYTAAEGVELNMIASDGTGTYLVRKLWNRTCTLKSLAINNATIGITSNTAGTVFADGVKVKWTFGSADASTVQIQNA